MLNEMNNFISKYPKHAFVHRFFEEQAECVPERICLVFGNEHLTYEELNNTANRFAHYLVGRGVGPDIRVAICLERSIDLVVSILAILKAGGTYIPIDPQYPIERQRFMLHDSKSKLLIANNDCSFGTLCSEINTIFLDERRTDILLESDENLIVGIVPDNLAYCIYTSGSTGRPKGVMISHRSLSNHMIWMIKRFDYTGADIFLQRTPFSFDASVWEFFASLMVGGLLVVATPDFHLDIRTMLKTIQNYRITVMQSVPAMMHILTGISELASVKSLRLIFCGGETLYTETVRQFNKLSTARLYNLYGPTECCIDASYYLCNDLLGNTIVPIGTPIDNTFIHILDNRLKKRPQNVTGEMYIGGVGLARGYHYLPDLTAEKFLPAPFKKMDGARMYRTGDLARWLPDGNIEFIGRVDHQVKIHGFRIELGEIESILLTHPNVEQCIVLARKIRSNDKQLVAYIVCDPTCIPSVFDLQGFIEQRLPRYMVPAFYVFIEALPLTPNGKVNRDALPDLGKQVLRSEYMAPRNNIETKLATIWANLLHLKRVGINDNFFILGGHSILAMQLIHRVSEATYIELSMASIYEFPTIRELAYHLTSLKEEQDSLREKELEKFLNQIESMTAKEVRLELDRKVGTVNNHG